VRGRALSLALLLGGCALPPVEFVGKFCPCPSSLVCVDGVCRISANEERDAGAIVGAEDAGVGQADGGADAGVTRGFSVLQLTGPTDDASWDNTRETLTTRDNTVEVGLGGTVSFAVRFAVPLPRGARITEAHLEIGRAHV
jgi:hypothetical protein